MKDDYGINCKVFFGKYSCMSYLGIWTTYTHKTGGIGLDGEIEPIKSHMMKCHHQAKNILLFFKSQMAKLVILVPV